MVFTGHLKMLNKKPAHAAKAAFLAANVGDLSTALGAGVDLTEVTTWLAAEVQTKDAYCKEVADDLLAFVQGCANALAVYAAAAAANRDIVGDFLAEALRTCNFAKHESAIITTFIGLFGNCGIVIVGNPAQCAHLATFAQLGYSQATHQVTMNPS